MADAPTHSIFIIDDDAVMRDSLAAMLEAHNYRVVSFASGESFLRHWDSPAQACLLLDIQMPNMTGLDLLKTLRTKGDQTPVILIAGRVTEAIEAQGGGLGAVAVLEKPIPLPKLFATLDRSFTPRPPR